MSHASKFSLYYRNLKSNMYSRVSIYERSNIMVVRLQLVKLTPSRVWKYTAIIISSSAYNNEAKIILPSDKQSFMNYISVLTIYSLYKQLKQTNQALEVFQAGIYSTIAVKSLLHNNLWPL